MENTSTEAQAPAHEHWIDLARAVCAVGVIAIHVFAGFDFSAVPPVRLALWQTLQIVLGRFAVPAFLLITGYLTLDPARTVDLNKVKSHVMRLLLLLGTFGLAFCVIEAFATKGISLSSIASAVYALLCGNSWDHMWYLYVLLGLWLLMPLWRYLATTCSREEYRWVLIVLFICTLCIYCIDWVIWIDLYSPVAIGIPAPFYLLMGGYVRRFVPERVGRLREAAFASLVILVVLSAGYTVARGNYAVYFVHYSNPLIAVFALAVLDELRNLDIEALRRQKWWLAVELISRESLGIYILHPVLINVAYKALGATPAVMPPFWAVVIWVAALVFGYGASRLLREVPLFKDIL